MSDCCSAFEDILFEPEEELSKADSLKLATHIARCENCRGERELFLESWSALEDFEPELDPCPLIRAKVWEQIREEEKLPPPLLEPETAESFTNLFQKLSIAGLALLLGFGLGRGLRPTPTAAQETAKTSDSVATASESSEDNFLDPALIELASREGYSVEIFPESTNFSPLDQEMRTALATSEEERTWVEQDQGAVVPVRYISQGGSGLGP